MLLYIIVTLALIASSAAFAPKFSKSVLSTTKLNEKFNLDFANPKIESDPLIFTEKQLREFTAEYSTDYRMGFNVKDILGLFAKQEEVIKVKVPKVAPVAPKPVAAKGGFSFSLPTISIPKISIPKIAVPNVMAATKAAPVQKAAPAAKSSPFSFLQSAVTAQATGGNQNGKRKTVKIK